jgi:outer membrane receptor protein involved in Fe transport
LPFTARFSGNFSLEQDFPLASQLTGFVGGSVSYVGDREDDFGTTLLPQRQDLPGFARIDLRAGTKYESWTANLYVTNLADKRGLLSGGLQDAPPFAFIYIQPRTVGLSIVRTF